MLREAKTEVILDGLPSILTKRKRKSAFENRGSDYSLSANRQKRVGYTINLMLYLPLVARVSVG